MVLQIVAKGQSVDFALDPPRLRRSGGGRRWRIYGKQEQGSGICQQQYCCERGWEQSGGRLAERSIIFVGQHGSEQYPH